MAYKKAYSGLNKAQKQAVDQIDGPLLVIAGPGTGKTQLLSVRVANILLKTDSEPSNILCLTFTNKAAVNMRERLLSLAGITTRDVYVRTFHSFAAEIMNLYPDYFWNGARLVLASDALQLEVINKLLARLPINSPLALKFAGQYTLVDDVINALKLAKEAGLTPAKLRAIIKANLEYIEKIEKDLVSLLDPQISSKRLTKLRQAISKIPDQDPIEFAAPLMPLSNIIKESLERALELDEAVQKTKNVSNWKRRWIQTANGQKGMFKERKRNNWWLAVSDVYESYRDQLHALGYYDYADMLVEAISKLEQNPELLADIQERFLYVLIDEFQDTNAAQLRLAHLVADHSSANGRPNLMAVGDDDQSIFKFNGAELSNMLSFMRSYPAAKLVVLTDNYRSSQAILDTSARIIAQANDRLVYRRPDIVKNLRAVNPPKKRGVIEHGVYQTREHQYSSVARHIKKMRAQSGSIAVLARGHESLRRLSALLVTLKVPVRYEQQSNILEHAAVRQITIIARLANAIETGDQNQVNTLLSQTLRHPMWNLDKKKLWQLALKNRNDSRWLDGLLTHPDKRFKLIGQWLLEISSLASHQPLPLVLEYILGLRAISNFSSPIRDYFAKNTDEGDYLHAISAIQLLRALAEEFSTSVSTNLKDFVRLIDINLNAGKVITDESPFVTQPNAVQLLSVHKAKGLEFDCVFIIDANEENWRPRAGRRKPPANLPLQPHGDDEDDYVRLMYVAATRARHTLIVSSFAADHAGKELLASPLVRGAIGSPKVIKPKSSDKPVQVLEENLRWPRLAAASERETLKARLEEYSLSVTGLLNFLDLTAGGPAYFLERNILRLPEAKTPNLAFGTAIHAALEQAQILVNKTGFKIKPVLAAFEIALKQEYLPLAEYERYLLHGRGVLNKLFKENGFKPPKGSLPEQAIKDVNIGLAKISGKLDRVDISTPSQLTIVDYKTGPPLSDLTTRDKTKALKAWKNRTQLIFYALLAQNSPRFRRANDIVGQMVYVEAEAPKQLVRTYTPSREEIARLKTLINAVWPRIVTIDLPDISGYTPDIDGVLKFEEDLINGRT